MCVTLILFTVGLIFLWNEIDINVINTTGALQKFKPYLSSATTFTVDDVSVTKKLDHVSKKTISTF